MLQARSKSAPDARKAALPMWRIGDGAPPSGAFIALAPGVDAPLITLGLPAALKGRAREDVAFRQTQDRLGGGAAMDIRPARLGQGDGWTRVAVADRAEVLRWRAALGSGAARCRAIVPDYIGLPTAPGLWTVQNEGDVMSIRLGPNDGFSAEPLLAVRLVTQALQQAQASNTVPRAILWLGAENTDILALCTGISVMTDIADLPEAQRPRLFAHEELALDFARDPRADAAGIEARLRRLVWPMMLLVVGVLGWAASTAILAQRDQASAMELEGETLSAARRDLLGAAPVLDLRVQVARAIDQRRSASPTPDAPTRALDILRAASVALAGRQVSVQSVAFGDGQTGVALDLTVSDFRALDAVLAVLLEAGLTADLIRSGIDPAGGVSAAIRITGVNP